jgi:hypothetical protein
MPVLLKSSISMPCNLSCLDARQGRANDPQAPCAHPFARVVRANEKAPLDADPASIRDRFHTGSAAVFPFAGTHSLRGPSLASHD